MFLNLQRSTSKQPRTSPMYRYEVQLSVNYKCTSYVEPKLSVAGGVRKLQVREYFGDRQRLSRDPTNFRGLVLGCIEAKFCK